MKIEREYWLEMLKEAESDDLGFIEVFSTEGHTPEGKKREGHANYLIEKGYFKKSGSVHCKITATGHDYLESIR